MGGGLLAATAAEELFWNSRFSYLTTWHSVDFGVKNIIIINSFCCTPEPGDNFLMISHVRYIRDFHKNQQNYRFLIVLHQS